MFNLNKPLVIARNGHVRAVALHVAFSETERVVGIQIRFEGAHIMEKIIDYLAEPVVDYLADETLTPEQAKRVKLTDLQKLEYRLYRNGCRLEGVEPVRAD